MGRNLGPLNIKDSYEGLVQISGSQLTDGSGSLIPSLDVSASYATTATSASHAVNSDTAVSASFATSASHATFAETAGGAVDVNALYTASAAGTTITFEKGDTSTFDVSIAVPSFDTGSLLTTASISDANITFTKGDASTFEIEVNNVSSSISASYVAGANVDGQVASAAAADTATSASHAVFADTAGFATDVNALYTASVSDATISFLKGGGGTFPITINNVANATAASTATSASHAVTADTASFLPADTNLNINSISASSAVFQSASIGFLETITGSAKIIGDAFIILNNNLPTERYAGIIVQDSGSANNTASLEWDGQTNDWFYNYEGDDPTDFGVVMFGPEYSTKGVPTYNTANTLVKADGGHHLLDSSITDDGSKVTSTVPLADMVLSGSKTVISGSVDIVLPTDASDVNIINPDEKLALIVRGGIMAGSDQALSTDNGFNNHLFGERITAGGSTQTAGALAAREVDFGGNPIQYSAFVATQGSNFDGGDRSAIIGGYQHTIETEDSLAIDSVIIAGEGNNMRAGDRNVIAGGNNNTIVEGNNRAIIGGKDNTLGYTSGQPEYSGSVILGGSGNSSQHNNTIFLGTTDITSDAHDTTYANNLHLTGSGATLTFDDGTTMTTAAAGGGELQLAGTTYYATDQTLLGSYDTGSVILGIGSSTSAIESVIIGNNASGIQAGQIAIGANADAGSQADAIAIGRLASAGGDDAVAIGAATTASATDAIAIGDRTSALGIGDIAMGQLSEATSNYGVAIGYGASSTAEDGVAIGRQSEALSADAVGIGFNARASSGAAIAIGQNADATGFVGVAIGGSAFAQGQNTVSIGRSCQSSAQDSIGIGQRANRASGATGAAALGSFTDVDNAYGTALGYGAQATGSLAMEFRVNQLPIMSATTASQDLTFYGGVDFTGDLTGVGKVTIGDALNVNSGTDAMLLAIDSNTTGTRSGVFAGYQNTASDTDAVVLGGFGNTASGLRGAVVSGQSNTASHIRSVVVGGISLSTSKDDEVVVPALQVNDDLELIGDSKIVGGDSNVMIGGNTTTLNSANTDMISIGGIGNTAGTNSNLRYGAIIGGGNNNFGTNNAAMGQSVMLGGNGNTMNSADDAACIGGGSNTNTHSRSVIIGGTSLSTSKSNEVVVPSLSTNGAVVQNVEALTIAANVAEIDASLGNMFTLTLQNGVNTELQITNQSAGQTFSLKITNNATAAGTITFDSQFDFEGGTAFTATAATNAVDILTFTTFDGTSVQCVGSKNFS